jgi:hypothetical protein
MMTGFDAFVGIDWSGASGPLQQGLKVAVAEPGHRAPQLVPGLGRKDRWSREAVVHWIADTVRARRALIGLDFAFGFPAAAIPPGAFDWDYVDLICKGAANFYGGAFFRTPDLQHSHLVNSPWLPKQSYSAGHLRATDFAAAKTRGARPQSIYNAVGAAQVGPSSISGMRALRDLKRTSSDVMAIWPFDELRDDKSVIVEIFPRYFPLSRPIPLSARLADHDNLNAALAAFDSDPAEIAPQSEDEGDAWLSAAALRYLSRSPSLFDLPDPAIRSEGWIFGVPVDRP